VTDVINAEETYGSHSAFSNQTHLPRFLSLSLSLSVSLSISIYLSVTQSVQAVQKSARYCRRCSCTVSCNWDRHNLFIGHRDGYIYTTLIGLCHAAQFQANYLALGPRQLFRNFVAQRQQSFLSVSSLELWWSAVLFWYRPFSLLSHVLIIGDQWRRSVVK